MSLGEFSIIQHFFSQEHYHHPTVIKGIGDDCALLQIPAGHQLAISSDTLVLGTHYLPSLSASDLAYKALAVNLSDLAACGATPCWLMLALTLPKVELSWLQSFSQSLLKNLADNQMQLIGGDTTQGPESLTLTVHGIVPIGSALTRSRAQIGDKIYVSGYLGDSAAGLAILLEQQQSINGNISTEDRDYLIQRHTRPTARIQLGTALRRIATSAIDLSDGLSSDLLHVLQQSQQAAIINLEQLPLSAAFQRVVPTSLWWQNALAGGEDYELCFTVAEKHQQELKNLSVQLGIPIRCIGEIIAGDPRIHYQQQGNVVPLQLRGYDHFAHSTR